MAQVMSSLATPRCAPWIDRRYPVGDDDPRDPFNRDRDRILHSHAFRQLQHKTQVYIIHEGDFYRTRLTHTLEVAQIARTIARLLELDEPLAEAIALAHDLGHTPFGHAGEAALDRLLREAGDEGGWDSNQHSLTVVDEIERLYPQHSGLNLTFAVRQGIARHQTPFDRPVAGFDPLSQPTPEAQAVNLADVIAYATHDIQDALEMGLLAPEQLLAAPEMGLWQRAWERAGEELQASPEAQGLSARTRERLRAVRARRHLIDRAVRDVWAHTRQAVQQMGIDSHAAAVGAPEPVVRFSPEMEAAVRATVTFLLREVYQSPLLRRQNFRSAHVLEQLFHALRQQPDLLAPPWRPPSGSGAPPRHVARFLASLTDRGAVDLYGELFDPRERVTGHFRFR